MTQGLYGQTISSTAEYDSNKPLTVIVVPRKESRTGREVEVPNIEAAIRFPVFLAYADPQREIVADLGELFREQVHEAVLKNPKYDGREMFAYLVDYRDQNTSSLFEQ